MSFNPLALLQERQCAPVYSALDSGNPSAALRQCDSLLAKQPDLHLAAALRSLALVRLGRRADASKQVDGLLAATSKNRTLLDGGSSLLHVLSIALGSLGRTSDEVEMLDAASKAAPSNIDLGARAFIAMAKTGQWQRAQQTSLRLSKAAAGSKGSDNDLHFWWSMQAYALVAADPSLPAHQLALPLATRMIQKHLETAPWGARSDEELFLYATILARQGDASKRQAVELLDAQKELRDKSMTLAILRTELLRELGQWITLCEEALQAMESGDDNWSHVQVLVEAVSKLHDDSSSGGKVTDAEARLSKLGEGKGAKNRGFRLARLELVRGLSHEQRTELSQPDLSKLIVAYFDDFSQKACAYEDLAPHALLLVEGSALQKVRETVAEEEAREIKTLDDLYRVLNACKLLRLVQADSKDAEMDRTLSKRYWDIYKRALVIGKDLPKTEMQPADDFALLAAQACVAASPPTPSDLVRAVSMLESALQHSPKGYRLRVLLIRLLRRLGSVDEAREHFSKLGARSVQLETLGWLLVDRSSSYRNMLPQGSSQEADFDSAVEGIARIWRENEREMPEMVAKAFENGIFSRIEEIVDFKKRLDSSLARQLYAAERALCPAKGDEDEERRREAVQRALRVSVPSDQRDFAVLLNLLPSSRGSIRELTSLTREDPGTRYVDGMLDVAAAVLGIEREHTDARGGGSDDELTASEKRLHDLARKILDKTSDVEAIAKAFFEGCLDEAKTTNPPFPADQLLVASVALQGYQLVARRQIDTKVTSASLRELRELFKEKREHVDFSSSSQGAVSVAEREQEEDTKVRLEAAARGAYDAVLGRLEACN